MIHCHLPVYVVLWRIQSVPCVVTEGTYIIRLFHVDMNDRNILPEVHVISKVEYSYPSNL